MGKAGPELGNHRSDGEAVHEWPGDSRKARDDSCGGTRGDRLLIQVILGCEQEGHIQ